MIDDTLPRLEGNENLFHPYCLELRGEAIERRLEHIDVVRADGSGERVKLEVEIIRELESFRCYRFGTLR